MINTLKNKLNQKAKKDNKGFTLVEIIVVLVILSILMAALVPSMIGFVNEARGKAYVTEARSAYVALQSKVTEKAATGTAYTQAEAETAFQKSIVSGAIANMMEGSYTTGAEISDIAVSGSSVTGLVYHVSSYWIRLVPNGTSSSAEIFTVATTLP